jgi:hydrogenase maturation protease
VTRAPLLVIAVGNPSRGDDALGPAFVDRARGALAGEIARGEVELLTDFQLQIEHALDVEGRDEVVFVDASVSAAAPYTFAPAAPAAPRGVTHAMAPAEVLGTCRAAVGAPGSVPAAPSPSSAWLRTPNGSTANSTTHQSTK